LHLAKKGLSDLMSDSSAYCDKCARQNAKSVEKKCEKTAFHRDHDTPGADMLRDLEAAIAQLPRKEYQAEARPLHEELKKIEAGGRRGPQLLGNILPIVLARLGVGAVQSTASGEEDPR
jgi:hypothetical protein